MQAAYDLARARKKESAIKVKRIRLQPHPAWISRLDREILAAPYPRDLAAQRMEIRDYLSAAFF